jgi:hypothetical protein
MSEELRLPELPSPDGFIECDARGSVDQAFIAEQMTAYAYEAVQEALELAAQIAQSTFEGCDGDGSDAPCFYGENSAEKIRKLAAAIRQPDEREQG